MFDCLKQVGVCPVTHIIWNMWWMVVCQVMGSALISSLGIWSGPVCLPLESFCMQWCIRVGSMRCLNGSALCWMVCAGVSNVIGSSSGLVHGESVCSCSCVCVCLRGGSSRWARWSVSILVTVAVSP